MRIQPGRHLQYQVDAGERSRIAVDPTNGNIYAGHGDHITECDSERSGRRSEHLGRQIRHLRRADPDPPLEYERTLAEPKGSP